jgi:palmitoyl-protein thioesterase
MITFCVLLFAAFAHGAIVRMETSSPSLSDGDKAFIAFSGLPIVVWHGIGDACGNSFSMQPFMAMLKNLTGSAVHCLQIGSDVEEDTLNGWFMPANAQIDFACRLLPSFAGIENGFIGMGLSQGGLFVRALLQRCDAASAMQRLIAIGGPQSGVMSFPRCDGNDTVCQVVADLIDLGVYYRFVQNSVSPAGYWHDTREEATYLADCLFLPDINNEQATKNATYRQRIMSLDHFVLVYFQADSVIFPRISEWFGYFANGSNTQVVPLQQSPQYTQDWLGLKTLDQRGALTFLSSPGDHLQFTDAWFKANIGPFL